MIFIFLTFESRIGPLSQATCLRVKYLVCLSIFVAICRSKKLFQDVSHSSLDWKNHFSYVVLSYLINLIIIRVQSPFFTNQVVVYTVAPPAGLWSEKGDFRREGGREIFQRPAGGATVYTTQGSSINDVMGERGQWLFDCNK